MVINIHMGLCMSKFILLFLILSLSAHADICVIPGHCGESSFDTKSNNAEATEVETTEINTNSSQEGTIGPVEQHIDRLPSLEETTVEHQIPNNQELSKTESQQTKQAIETNTIQEAKYKTTNTIVASDIPLAESAPIASSNTDYPILLFFCIGLITYFVIKQFKRESESRATNRALETSNNLIFSHVDELTKLRSQLSLRGDFNIIDDQKWQRKKEEFLIKIIYPALIAKFPDRASNFIQEYSDHLKSEIDIKTSGFNSIDLSQLDVKTPVDFELFVASKLISYGWDARTTKTVGDQGVDVLANKGLVSVAIQCKFYTNPVGNDAVQQVVGGKGFYKTTHAAVVTNSSYTFSAKQLAQSMDVLLLHHSELEKLNLLA